jgi:DNA-binding FrmR family transcriptional regulator
LQHVTPITAGSQAFAFVAVADEGNPEPKERSRMVADISPAALDDVTSSCAPDHSYSYAADKAKLLARLRRIEGQVRGVARMVEEDKYCIDILTQISAIVSSTQAVGLLLLEDHIRGCVVDAGPEDREERLQELNRAIERFTRSVR